MKVNQIDSDGKLVKTWNSVNEVMHFLNVLNKNALTDCLKNRRDNYKGFKWQYCT